MGIQLLPINVKGKRDEPDKQAFLFVFHNNEKTSRKLDVTKLKGDAKDSG